MPSVNLRHSVRAIILDDDNRVLLCRIELRDPPDLVVWAAPGGGIESGETPLAALRRELYEEVGLGLSDTPPHVWRQTVVDPGVVTGYDGVLNDYYLVRTRCFQPRGGLTREQLLEENLNGARWWAVGDIADYHGADLFSPRDLAAPLAALITDGAPATPVPLGT